MAGNDERRGCRNGSYGRDLLTAYGWIESLTMPASAVWGGHILGGGEVPPVAGDLRGSLVAEGTRRRRCPEANLHNLLDRTVVSRSVERACNLGTKPVYFISASCATDHETRVAQP